MSVIWRTGFLRQIRSTAMKTLTTSAHKNTLYNLDDYKPGPMPKTQEEREAAAKKYNLHPSEYEPIPDDDGLGKGDYPKLPDIAVEDRDPFYPWDEPALKRNYNEAVHAEIDLIGEDRYHISMRPRFSNKQMIATFLGVMTMFFTLVILAEPYPVFRPVLEKQMPRPGVVHYSFEKD